MSSLDRLNRDKRLLSKSVCSFLEELFPDWNKTEAGTGRHR